MSLDRLLQLQIRPLALPCASLGPLRLEAEAGGLRFLERLVDDWESGLNRFDRHGECLLGGYVGTQLLAVGGLNRDPYSAADAIGRLRHLYVLKGHRRQNIGFALVGELLRRAQGVFTKVRLRTDEEQAARFYVKCGFLPVRDDAHASHIRAV